MTDDTKQDGAPEGQSASKAMLDARSPLRTMAERFRQRDKLAVDEFNEHISCHGISLEARLSFAESRLLDVASLLCMALEKIADMESNEEVCRAATEPTEAARLNRRRHE